MSLFGIDNNIGKAAVEEAVAKMDPLLHEVTLRLAGVLDTLVDRIGGATIEIKIHIPKAGADWEKTKPQ